MGAGTATNYTYGSNGELRTKVTGASTTSYTYDALGNLTRVGLPSGAQIDYVIDGQNRRVGRKVNGAVTHRWLYQNQLNPVAELDGAGNLVSRFVYGTRVNVPDYLVQGGTTYRLITDHLGSVRLVVDTATGTVARWVQYDPWGNVTADSGAGVQPFGFAGGLTDDSTTLVRFGARDYDPALGRWTAKDPVGFGGGETAVFTYAGNDPVDFVDPTGLEITLNWIPSPRPGYHTFIRFAPENQAPYLLIGRAGPFGRLSFTISAGPPHPPLPSGSLDSRLNRSPDADPLNAHGDGMSPSSPLGTPPPLTIKPPGCMGEDQFIRLLLQLDANYRDNVSYSMSAGLLGGYNSNSYISGLLAAAGVSVQPPVWVPGWQRPVPAEYFGR